MAYIRSDAQATIEFAIGNGLVLSANITKITANNRQIITDAIMIELFAPEVIWAVREYLQELNNVKKKKK